MISWVVVRIKLERNVKHLKKHVKHGKLLCIVLVRETTDINYVFI